MYLFSTTDTTLYINGSNSTMFLQIVFIRNNNSRQWNETDWGSFIESVNMLSLTVQI